MLIFNGLAVQEHNTGFRENNWAAMPLKVGPVPFHMIFQLHFHYVIPIISELIDYYLGEYNLLVTWTVQ
jgi:hypothetical protein